MGFNAIYISVLSSARFPLIVTEKHTPKKKPCVGDRERVSEGEREAMFYYLTVLPSLLYDTFCKNSQKNGKMFFNYPFSFLRSNFTITAN